MIQDIGYGGRPRFQYLSNFPYASIYHLEAHVGFLYMYSPSSNSHGLLKLTETLDLYDAYLDAIKIQRYLIKHVSVSSMMAQPGFSPHDYNCVHGKNLYPPLVASVWCTCWPASKTISTSPVSWKSSNPFPTSFTDFFDDADKPEQTQPAYCMPHETASYPLWHKGIHRNYCKKCGEWLGEFKP